MKLAISSTMGNPEHPKTWSAAPYNLMSTLRSLGVAIEPIDSSLFSTSQKAFLAAAALAQLHPFKAAQRLWPAIGMRASHVAREARRIGADHVICCGSMDAPSGMRIPYSIWMDNSWDLLAKSAVDQKFPKRTKRAIDEWERRALDGARFVFTFSDHVRANVIDHYRVPAQRVIAVGCGSGNIQPLDGGKDYGAGHLLFVAKHLFEEKGGELVLQAFDLVRKVRPQTRLVVVGTDEMAQRLKGRDGIEAYGFVPTEKLNDLFHGASILVQPMIADPWGQVYLEAMKAKAIVVALNVAAVPELTENGLLAALAHSPTPEAVAEAIMGVFARSNAINSDVAQRAQSRTLSLYSWPVVAERILSGLRTAVE